jgi:phosphonate transport system substrate-binding protein
MNFRVVALSGISLLWASALAGAAETLQLSTLSTRPDYHLPRLQPIADYVQKRMLDLGYQKAQVRLTKDAKTLCELFRQGEMDWAGVTIAAAIQLRQDCNSELFLRGADDESDFTYRTVFYVNQSGRNAKISSLQDLRGKRLALRSKGSTSSYYVPLIMLQQDQVPYVIRPSWRAPIVPGVVNVVLAGSETNCGLWVKYGLAEVGVANSKDLLDNAFFPPELRQSLHIVLQSEAVPLGVEMVRSDMSGAEKARLRAALFELGESSEGQKLIQNYNAATRFEAISDSVHAQLKRYSILFRRVESSAP